MVKEVIVDVLVVKFNFFIGFCLMVDSMSWMVWFELVVVLGFIIKKNRELVMVDFNGVIVRLLIFVNEFVWFEKIVDVSN